MPTRATCRTSTQAWLRLPPSLRQHSSLHSSSVVAASSSTTHSQDASNNPPILLLEGDQFCVSDEGVARTLYQLEGQAAPSRNSYLLAIEELYNLSDSTKDFIVRQDGRLSEPCVSKDQREVLLGQHAQGLVRIGPCLTSIKLQEIDEGENLFSGRAGTGATTWEASIAMGLYFANHPEQLRGHVVEVGCGMGLGGILNYKVMEANATGGDWEAFPELCNRSITLTDGNIDVVEQCKKNVRQNMRNDRNFLQGPISSGARPTSPIQVGKLDWNDFVSLDEKAHQKRYDTVIACDCAYLHNHVSVLSRTLQGLLKKENGKHPPRPTIHLFGPYNRSALHEVIRYLSDELGMHVMLESVEMSRFRLKPFQHSQRKMLQTVKLDECAFASKASAKFLHVMVTIRKPDEGETNLFNID